MSSASSGMPEISDTSVAKSALSPLQKQSDASIAKNLSSSLVVKNASQSLVCPSIRAELAVMAPHPVRRGVSRVMAEEDYVDAVEKIIQRDYYPDLPRLRATKILLDARDERDPQKIREARLKLECLTPITVAGTPSLTFSGRRVRPQSTSFNRAAAGGMVTPGVTPIHTAGGFGTWRGKQDDGNHIRKKAGRSCASSSCGGISVNSSKFDIRGQRDADVSSETNIVRLADGREVVVDLHNMRLDKFQSLYTSEDNASFDKIIQEEKKKLTAEEAWIENAATLHNRQVCDVMNRSAIADQSSGVLPSLNDNMGMLYTAAEPRPFLLFEPNFLGVPPVQPYASKEILKGNTRFPTVLQDSQEQLERQRVKMYRLKQKNQKDSSLDGMVKEGQFTQHEGEDDGNTPSTFGDETLGLTGEYYSAATSDMIEGGRMKNYRFEKTPTIQPGMGPDASPLMTWGEVGGTPLLLEKGNRPVDVSAENGNTAEHEDTEGEYDLDILAAAGNELLGYGDPTAAVFYDIGGKHFEVPDQPAKEAAGHRLAEKFVKSNDSVRRKRTGLLLQQPQHPNSTSLFAARGATPTTTMRMVRSSGVLTPLGSGSMLNSIRKFQRNVKGGTPQRLPSTLLLAAQRTPLLRSTLEGSRRRSVAKLRKGERRHSSTKRRKKTKIDKPLRDELNDGTSKKLTTSQECVDVTEKKQQNDREVAGSQLGGGEELACNRSMQDEFEGRDESLVKNISKSLTDNLLEI